MFDMHEAIENLLAIHTYRTPISLKAYCLIFIYIFPLIYTPTIINKVGLETTIWITYFVVILSQFILISLYNIQDHLEYPFDEEGLDDIKLKNFKINR
jgi:predicted membrane chloride channel (bestrophin family)